MSRLLRGRTERHDDWTNHRQPEWHLPWRAPDETLFLEDGALACLPAGTAVFLRPPWRAPATAMQNFLPADVVLALDAAKVQNRIADVRRQMGLNEAAHFGAESEILRGV